MEIIEVMKKGKNQRSSRVKQRSKTGNKIKWGSMNWRIVIGVLLIIGGIKEFFAVMKDSQAAVPAFNPIYGQLGCITMIGLGSFLVYKGRQKKTLK